MPREEAGETYLSGPEAMKFLGIESPITFRAIRTKYEIEAYKMLGEGKTLYYKEDALAKIPRVQQATSAANQE